MNISIAERLKPFSHTYGINCLIPGTQWKVKAFPTYWVFKNIETFKEFTVDVEISGPYQEFTCLQDLEKGKVTIFFQSQKGYFRFDIMGFSEGIELIFVKGTPEGVSIITKKNEQKIYPKDRILLTSSEEKMGSFSSEFERLSLGASKKQDWDLMMRRKDLREIFPIWMKAASSTSNKQHPFSHPVLDQCKRLIHEGRTHELYDAFSLLFQLSFEGMMCPTIEDKNHLKVFDKPLAPISAFEIMQKGAELIRSLFFQQKEDHLFILPNLPSKMICGRFIKIYSEDIGVIDFEWSKGKIKKFILHACSNKTIHLHFQKEIGEYRLKQKLSDKGIIINSKEALNIRSGNTYILDRFQK
ncbi:MAG: hypothetical protein PVI40_00185 [Chlamydiota bacterium]|jgi:hypothetical protein